MSGTSPIQLAELAHKLADRACIVDIEDLQCQTDPQGRRWYDTRPMVDPSKWPDEFIDMNIDTLTYAHERGLISPHPVESHLVRITKDVR